MSEHRLPIPTGPLGSTGLEISRLGLGAWAIGGGEWQGDGTPEAYQDVIAGHEPAGQIVAVGSDCRRFGEGDRVALYHIAGCGLCSDCRSGYMISCTSPRRPV
jgi:threonine dehydrogenase-like Zn-dependent dehydrogenase